MQNAQGEESGLDFENRVFFPSKVSEVQEVISTQLNMH